MASTSDCEAPTQVKCGATRRSVSRRMRMTHSCVRLRGELSALEIRHLEPLLALAECGNLSKAAARLFLTQSALSHQLKTLESHYGAALVEKNIRPLRFTAIGHRLVTLAKAVLPQV